MNTYKVKDSKDPLNGSIVEIVERLNDKEDHCSVRIIHTSNPKFRNGTDEIVRMKHLVKILNKA